MNEIFELLEQNASENPEVSEAPEITERELGDLMWKLHNGYELTPEQREHAQILELIQMKQAVLERSFVLLKQAVDTLLEDRRKDAEREANRTNKHGDVVGNTYNLRVAETVIGKWKEYCTDVENELGDKPTVLMEANERFRSKLSIPSSLERGRETERKKFIADAKNNNLLEGLNKPRIQHVLNNEISNYSSELYALINTFLKLSEYSFSVTDNSSIELSKNGLFKQEGKLYAQLGPILGSEFSGDIGIYETFCKNIVDTVFEDKKLLKEYHGEAWVYDHAELFNIQDNDGSPIQLRFNNEGKDGFIDVDYLELSALQKGMDVGQRKMYVSGFTSEGESFRHTLKVIFELVVDTNALESNPKCNK